MTSKVTINCSEVEAAWLAGLIEGEGYICAHNGCRAQIILEMTDEDVIREAAAIMDPEANVNYYDRSSRSNGERKDSWKVHVNGDKAVAVLELIYPWMGKRRSAKINEVLEAHR